MANIDSTTERIINGFHPATALDIECMANITYEQAMAMEVMFKTIARLTTDEDIKALCRHGALQAALQGNDIDCTREVVVKAGVVGCLREVHHG